MKGQVYVLMLKNGRYYVGSTNDLSRRIKQHNDGQVISTRNLRPLEIIYSREFDSLIEARQKEYRLKKQKSKKIIEKFIMDQFGWCEPIYRLGDRFDSDRVQIKTK